MQVKPSQATAMITACIKAKLVPMLEGSPGIGKSMIVRQIAQEYGLKVIDLRLSQCDPCDLLGFPSITDNRAGYKPMDTFPIEGDAVPGGYNGWLLFLDEFTSAPPAVQAAAYRVVLDRHIGQYPLHKNVAIVCAGNKETDNAIVQPMSTAMQSRLVHMELIVDSKEWCEWADKAQFDHRITSYVRFKPGVLYTFRPDHTDKTYASPRTWEFANRLMQVSQVEDALFLPTLAGTLSEGVAREFLSFCKIQNTLPKLETILASPEIVEVPREPSILYALTGSLSHHASESNMAQMMRFIDRLPIEFQVVCMRGTHQRKPELLAHQALQGWITKNAAELF